MSEDEPLDSHSTSEFTELVHRVNADYDAIKVVLKTREGAPTLTEVTDCLDQLQRDSVEAWTFAELIRYARTEQDQPEWVRRRLNVLRSLQPENVDWQREPDRGYGVAYEGREYNQPDLRFHSAQYYNPLETIIAVSAASVVLLTMSTVWAVRSFVRIKGERKLSRYINRLVDQVAEVIAGGDPKSIAAIRPIALGVIDYAVKYQSIGGQMDIEVDKMIKIKAKTTGA